MVAGSDDAGWPDDAVEVGRIVDAWGLKGGIKVQPWSTDPQALFSSRRWFLKAPEGARGAPAVPPLLKITGAREQGGLVVATAQTIEDRNAAEALKGARVFVARTSFPTAETDEFYWVDLIGLAVVNRQGEHLGTVTDLVDTGVHSVLCVRAQAQDSPERLIPFVAAYIDGVSLADKRIRVDWGLDY